MYFLRLIHTVRLPFAMRNQRYDNYSSIIHRDIYIRYIHRYA